MCEQDQYWRSQYDVENQQTFTKSLSSLQELQESVPLVYGKKNQRYVSPTFRSNDILYGDQKLRQSTKQQFYTINDATLSSPRVDSKNRHQQFGYQCQSTNQFAPFQNNFHKSPLNANLKNFSQVTLGNNENVELHYRKQFSQKKNIAELKFNVRDSMNPSLSYNKIQSVNQNNKQRRAFKEVPIQDCQWKPVKDQPQVQYYDDINDDYQIPAQFQKKPQNNRERPLSPQPQKKVQTLISEEIEIESPKRCWSPRVTNQTYEKPDWCFFSPQMDPFTRAFQVRSQQRLKYVDRVLDDQKAFYEDMKGRQKKEVLQNNYGKRCGDTFVQTFQGDTLSLAHYKREKSVDKRRRIIQHCFSQENLNKQVLQNDEFGQGGLYSMIGERNQAQVQKQMNQNRDYIQKQMFETTQRKHYDKLQKIQTEREHLNSAMQKAQQQIDFINHHNELSKRELKAFYDEAQERKQNKRQQLYLMKSQERVKIDQAYNQSQQKLFEADKIKKEIQNGLLESYQAKINNKKMARNYQPINQRISVQNNYQQSTMQLNRQNLQGFERQTVTGTQFHKSQAFMGYGVGNSNASTISSSCSVQQFTKANISKAEFELRKKQLQNNKQVPLRRSNSPRKKQTNVKFNVKSQQIERCNENMKRYL